MRRTNRLSWPQVLRVLRSKPTGEVLRLPKADIGHPRDVGMERSLGLLEGQDADYRKVLRDGAGFHVREYADYYTVHIDRVDPSVNLIEHLRQDAPKALVASSAALGAAAGGLLGKSVGACFFGCLLGLVFGDLMNEPANRSIFV